MNGRRDCQDPITTTASGRLDRVSDARVFQTFAVHYDFDFAGLFNHNAAFKLLPNVDSQATRFRIDETEGNEVKTVIGSDKLFDKETTGQIPLLRFRNPEGEMGTVRAFDTEGSRRDGRDGGVFDDFDFFDRVRGRSPEADFDNPVDRFDKGGVDVRGVVVGTLSDFDKVNQQAAEASNFGFGFGLRDFARILTQQVQNFEGFRVKKNRRSLFRFLTRTVASEAYAFELRYAVRDCSPTINTGTAASVAGLGLGLGGNCHVLGPS